MKIHKRPFSAVVSCVLCVAMLSLSMSGCTNNGADEPTSGANATYTATSKGYGGDVTVTVVVDGGKITSVSAEGASETQGVGGKAITEFNDGKLGNLVGQEAESCEFTIDALSGATMTSTALKNCLTDIKGQITGIKSAEKTSLTAGTYVETVYGNNYSRPFEVTVVLSANSIDSIEVTNIGGETADIIQTAIDKLIPRIKESQSIAVDSIAGATASSSGIKTAVASAIDGAGGDSSQWYTDVAKKADTIVLKDYDVIVVGLGGAGMPAFCSAAETGAAVIGIEAAGKIGGTSTNVGGPMTINPVSAAVQPASGTAGYPVDTKALKSQWLSDTKGEAKESCIDLMLEDSGSAVDWLIDNYDFTFGPLQNFMGYNFIVYSSYKPAAGQTVTDMYVHAIEKACENNEKDKYVLELKASKILTDENGEVCGVSAEYYDGTTYEIYAPSVVLCTGGFGGSSEMTEKYIGSAMSLYGMYQNDGTMLQAAISDLGAATFNIATPGICHAARAATDLRSSDIIPSHQKALDAIVVSTNVLHVNEDGNRFCQGDTTTDITENAYKAGNCYYSIVTQDYMDQVKAEGLDQVYMMINGQDESLPLSALMGANVEIDPETAKYALMAGDPITDLDDILTLGEQLGIVYKADSLEGLAKLIGADNLANTVAAYNGYCASKTDTEFNKSAENLVALDAKSTTFYAIKGTSYCYSTCGGLDVNEKIEVLDTNGNVIKGLYACGTDSMGVLLNVEEGYFDYGGIAHGWCFTSGKIAGENAAEYALSKKTD